MEKLKTIKSLFKYIFAKKRYWLLPLIIILMLTALLLFVFAGTTITPFIYTIF